MCMAGNLPLLTWSPSAWRSRILYRRGRKCRGELLIILYLTRFTKTEVWIPSHSVAAHCIRCMTEIHKAENIFQSTCMFITKSRNPFRLNLVLGSTLNLTKLFLCVSLSVHSNILTTSHNTHAVVFIILFRNKKCLLPFRLLSSLHMESTYYGINTSECSSQLHNFSSKWQNSVWTRTTTNHINFVLLNFIPSITPKHHVNSAEIAHCCYYSAHFDL